MQDLINLINLVIFKLWRNKVLVTHSVLICFLMCACLFVFRVSEHSCDVDSTPEGELCLPLLSPADAPPYLHPQVNSLSASLS